MNEIKYHHIPVEASSKQNEPVWVLSLRSVCTCSIIVVLVQLLITTTATITTKTWLADLSHNFGLFCKVVQSGEFSCSMQVAKQGYVNIIKIQTSYQIEYRLFISSIDSVFLSYPV